ncbi:hypothetical protein [Terrimonas alba]|uniref:hypothetical protein n=1 Tax=Terrimonas alba TaxID=3349636 RepID=UPI0035F4364B
MKRSLQKSGLRLIAFVLLCASFLTGTAQTAKPISKIYLQADAGGGTYKSTDAGFGLKTIIHSKWSMTLSYKAVEMKPKNLPSDYQPETGYVFFIPYTYEVTIDMKMINLSAGKYFNLGKNFWATTEGGLSYVKGEKVNFERIEPVSGNIIIVSTTTSNYNSTKENKSTIGAILQADINWGFASFMGLGAGVYANINSVQSPVGIHLKLLIGKTGRVKKHKRLTQS